MNVSGELFSLQERLENEKKSLSLPLRDPPKILQVGLDWRQIALPLADVDRLQLTVSARVSDPTMFLYDSTGIVSVGGMASRIDDLREHEHPQVREWVSTIDDRLVGRILRGEQLPPVILISPVFFSSGNIPDGNHRVLATSSVFHQYGVERPLNAFFAEIPKGLWISWNLTTIFLSYLRDPSVCIRLIRDRVAHQRMVGDPLSRYRGW